MSAPLPIVAVLIGLAGLTGSAAGAEQAGEICRVIVEDPQSGDHEFTFSVSELTAESTFRLPAQAPENTGAVLCRRANLIPAANDYKVLLAGYPFAIADPRGQVLWLMLDDGQVMVEYPQGALSREEEQQLQNWTNEVQRHFQTSP